MEGGKSIAGDGKGGVIMMEGTHSVTRSRIIGHVKDKRMIDTIDFCASHQATLCSRR